jgi:hypothetical protein
MDNDMLKGFWLLSNSDEIMDRHNILVLQDRERSDFKATKLWEPGSQIDESLKLVYWLETGTIDKLWTFDYLPGTASCPVVTERMKNALEECIPASDVGFRKCDVFDRQGNSMEAYTTFPKKCRRCVDRDASDADWFIPSLKPDRIMITKSRHIIWAEENFNELNIVRVREYMPFIIVSNIVKETFEIINSKGLSFSRKGKIPL